MPQLTNNSTHCPWSPEDQNLYIQSSHEKYQNFIKNRSSILLEKTTYHYGDQEQKLFIVKLYKEGRVLEKLKITFDVFFDAIVHGGGKFATYYTNDYYWYDRHGTCYRKKLGYQKKHNQQKSVSEIEQSSRDWREKKQLNRDRRKGNYWGRGRKTYAKTVCNRWNRRREQQSIHNEEYDNFPVLRQIHDRWFWD